MIFVMPYTLKNSKSKALNTKSFSITYYMGWFGRNSDDTKNDSGAKIDWDAYDSLNNTNYKPENRGTIEVPANAETVIYESPDGETYEIPVSDLIDADDEGEITYSSKGFSVSKPSYKPKTHRINKHIGGGSKYLAMSLKQQGVARVR